MNKVDRKEKYNSKYTILRFMENKEEQKLYAKHGYGIVSLYYLVHLYWLCYFAYQPSIENSLINDGEKRKYKGICPCCFSIVYYFGHPEDAKVYHKKVCSKRQNLLINELNNINMKNRQTFIHRKARRYGLSCSNLSTFVDFLNQNRKFFIDNDYIIDYETDY